MLPSADLRVNPKSNARGACARSQLQRIFCRGAIGSIAAGLLLGACDTRPTQDAAKGTPTPLPVTTAPSSADLNSRKSQTELAQMFRAARSVISAKTSAELAKIKPYKNVTLTPEQDGLRVLATTDDPSILLPAFVGQRLIVRVAIKSPADSTMQLFYLLRGQRTYTFPQSLKQPIKAGDNLIYFVLPDLPEARPLRLDPGMAPGEYLIQSFEAKSVAATGAP
jgi:hypothetical protein